MNLSLSDLSIARDWLIRCGNEYAGCDDDDDVDDADADDESDEFMSRFSGRTYALLLVVIFSFNSLFTRPK